MLLAQFQVARAIMAQQSSLLLMGKRARVCERASERERASKSVWEREPEEITTTKTATTANNQTDHENNQHTEKQLAAWPESSGTILLLKRHRANCFRVASRLWVFWANERASTIVHIVLACGVLAKLCWMTELCKYFIVQNLKKKLDINNLNGK